MESPKKGKRLIYTRWRFLMKYRIIWIRSKIQLCVLGLELEISRLNRQNAHCFLYCNVSIVSRWRFLNIYPLLIQYFLHMFISRGQWGQTEQYTEMILECDRRNYLHSDDRIKNIVVLISYIYSVSDDSRKFLHLLPRTCMDQAFVCI